jgi:AcrR family transcriptional regulator
VPAERRDQLLDIAADIIRASGLHAASMKRIASAAGISETQVYNYFRSREELFVLLAQRESARIQEARFAEMNKVEGHYAKITVGTQVYLRQIDESGGLMQTLLSNPEVRRDIREQQRRINTVTTASHAINLVQLYGISKGMAIGATVVLSRLCLRAGKLIADKRISLEAGERLCLAMVLNGSRSITGARSDERAGRTKGLEAA